MNVHVSSSDERAVNVRADLVRVPAAELDREDDDERRDEHDEEGADRGDEQVEQVHLGRDRRRARREQGKGS